MLRLFDFIRKHKEASEPENQSAQLSQEIFAEIRSLNIHGALKLASNMSRKNPNTALYAFLEGVLAYAVRSDDLALKRFRACMKMDPLFAEVPFYVGQMLTESAINGYSKAFPGPYTAEKTLCWAKTYDEAVNAFACAEEIYGAKKLLSISKRLRTYENLLGTFSFTRIATMHRDSLFIDDSYTDPTKWLSQIEIDFKKEQVTRRESIADMVSNFAKEPSMVYAIGEHDILSPISVLLLRRKQVTIFEADPSVSDGMLKTRMQSIKTGTVVLADPRRIGFGGYFPWTSIDTEAVNIVIINPQSLLSVELIGLLARLGCDHNKLPTIHFTLIEFV